MQEQQTQPDLSSLGLIPDQATPAEIPTPTDEDLINAVLDSVGQSVGQINQLVLGQRLIIQSMEQRLERVERLLAMLALKDPDAGPVLKTMAESMGLKLKEDAVADAKPAVTAGSTDEQSK